MAKVFISYSRDDRDIVVSLANRLGEAGHSVWWDAALHGGARFEDAINAALKDAEVVIVIWSSTAIKSDWVRAEADFARKRKMAIPAIIDSTTSDDLPLLFQGLHTIDLRRWSGDSTSPAFRDLLRSIDEMADDEPVPPAPVEPVPAPVVEKAEPPSQPKPAVVEAEPAAPTREIVRPPPFQPQSSGSGRRRLYIVGGLVAAAVVLAIAWVPLRTAMTPLKYAECGLSSRQVKSDAGDFSLCMGLEWQARDTKPTSYFNDTGRSTFHLLNMSGTPNLADSYPNLDSDRVYGVETKATFANRTWRVQPMTASLKTGGKVYFVAYMNASPSNEPTILYFSSQDSLDALMGRAQPLLQSATFIRD